MPEIVIDGPDGPDESLLTGQDMLVDVPEPSKDDEQDDPKPDPNILDGDDVPDRLKGKTGREAAAYARALEDALRASESAREQLSQQRPSALPAPAPAPARPAELTDVQIREMLTASPEQAQQAVQIMIERALGPRDDNYRRRADTLTDSAARLAESEARARYPLEFSALGSHITALVAGLPDKSGLTTPDGWDNVVSYVRGKHIKEYDEARDRAKAQHREAERAGPSVNGTPRQRQASSGTITDATERKIMMGLDWDPDDPKQVREWLKWKGAR